MHENYWKQNVRVNNRQKEICWPWMMKKKFNFGMKDILTLYYNLSYKYWIVFWIFIWGLYTKTKQTKIEK